MSNQLTESVVRKIVFARYLYSLATDCFRSDNAISIGTGIILLQDAVEIYLVAIAEKLDIAFHGIPKFEDYLNKIKEKRNQPLPLQEKLKQLNKHRVNAKHYGITPSIDEAKHYVHTVMDFFEDTSIEIFNKEFKAITLTDLIDEGEAKSHLRNAENNLMSNNYAECLIDCRKAIYEEIEKRYSIEIFKDLDSANGLLGSGSDAPYEAKSKRFIERYVKDPTDYIVYDFIKLSIDLLEAGVRSEDFWNIRRLTPDIFFDSSTREWVVKHEIDKIDTPDVKQNAEHVFERTVELILTLHKNRRRVKTVQFAYGMIKLRNKEVYVYEKADLSSKVMFKLPSNTGKLVSRFSVRGLKNKDLFYHVSTLDVPDIGFVYGYIHQDDIEEAGVQYSVDEQSSNP